VEVELHAFITSAQDGDEWAALPPVPTDISKYVVKSTTNQVSFFISSSNRFISRPFIICFVSLFPSVFLRHMRSVSI